MPRADKADMWGGFRASMAIGGGEMRGELVCHDEHDVGLLHGGSFVG